jgi:hypothetical protein
VVPVVRSLKALREIEGPSPDRGPVEYKAVRAARPSAVGEPAYPAEDETQSGGRCFVVGHAVGCRMNRVSMPYPAVRRLGHRWFLFCSASQDGFVPQGRKCASRVRPVRVASAKRGSCSGWRVPKVRCGNSRPQVLANNSLNRTRRSVPSSGPTFHSGPAAVTPRRSG